MAEREGDLGQANDEIEQFRTWMRGEGTDPYANLDEEEEPAAAEEEKEPPPSVERRKNRQITVTFGEQEMVERLRNLCDVWSLKVPHRSDPAISELVEYLITPRLEAAEEGELWILQAKRGGPTVMGSSFSQKLSKRQNPYCGQ